MSDIHEIASKLPEIKILFEKAIDAYETAEEPYTVSDCAGISGYLGYAYEDGQSLGKGDSSAPGNSKDGILWVINAASMDGQFYADSATQGAWFDEEYEYLAFEGNTRDAWAIVDAAYDQFEATGVPQPVTINGKTFHIDDDLNSEDAVVLYENLKHYDPSWFLSDYGGAGAAGFAEWGVEAIEQWLEWYENGELVEQGYDVEMNL